MHSFIFKPKTVFLFVIIATVNSSTWANGRHPITVVRDFLAEEFRKPLKVFRDLNDIAPQANNVTANFIDTYKSAVRTTQKCFETAAGGPPFQMEIYIVPKSYEPIDEVYVHTPKKELDLRSGSVSVSVNTFHFDQRYPKAHEHRSYSQVITFELSKISGKWLISNIKHEDGNSVTALLKSYMKESDGMCVK